MMAGLESEADLVLMAQMMCEAGITPEQLASSGFLSGDNDDNALSSVEDPSAKTTTERPRGSYSYGEAQQMTKITPESFAFLFFVCCPFWPFIEPMRNTDEGM